MGTSQWAAWPWLLSWLGLTALAPPGDLANDLANSMADDQPLGLSKATPRPTTWLMTWPTTCLMMAGLGLPQASLPGKTRRPWPSTVHGAGECSTALTHVVPGPAEANMQLGTLPGMFCGFLGPPGKP